ncbi:helix-turn-helix transcriptional regulator [Cedecea lapagei]|nr:LuxR C-terminal-related transcriptional regulator [Cedecea lapagei]
MQSYLKIHTFLWGSHRFYPAPMVGAFFFDIVCYTGIERLSPMQYDLVIADDITRAAFLLSLAPVHSLNEVMYCAPQPGRRFQEFQTGFPDETTQWRLITRSANHRLTQQEAEIRDYLATEKSTSEIALLTGKSNKRISYYKQKIKKKSYCRNDAELFRALCLMKGIVYYEPVINSV